MVHLVEMEQPTQLQVLLLQDLEEEAVVIGPLALIQQQAQVDLVAVDLDLMDLIKTILSLYDELFESDIGDFILSNLNKNEIKAVKIIKGDFCIPKHGMHLPEYLHRPLILL